MAKKEISMDSFDLLTSFLEGSMQKHAEANQNEAPGVDEKSGAQTGAHVNAPSNENTTVKDPKKAKTNAGAQASGKSTTTDAVETSIDGAPTNLPTSTEHVGQNKEAMLAKVARAERLGKAIASELDKVAGVMEAPAVATPEDMIVKEATDFASECAYWYAKGMHQRTLDAMELKEASINPELLSKVGGIDGLLDKCAEEALPPELAGMADESPEAEAAEGAPHAEPDGDEDAALSQIAQVLEANGITEEDINEFLQQIMAAKQSGMSDEAIHQALAELGQQAVPQQKEASAQSLCHEDQVSVCKNFFAGAR